MEATDQSNKQATSSDLIVRIDERTQTFSRDLLGVKSEVTDLNKKVTAIENRLTEFNLVKAIVFGGVGFVLLAIIGAIIGLIIIKPR